MKKLIVSVLVVCLVLMMAVPVSASYYRCKILKADFEWWIDKWDRLVLDGTCSTGNIQEYRWEIRNYEECLDWSIEWVDPIECGSGRIYKTYLQPGRYLVTLIVIDSKGLKDSINRLVKIPEVERRTYKPRVSVEFILTKEITLTEEQRRSLFFLGLIGLIIGLSGF